MLAALALAACSSRTEQRVVHGMVMGSALGAWAGGPGILLGAAVGGGVGVVAGELTGAYGMDDDVLVVSAPTSVK